MNIRPMTDVEKRSAAKAFVETWTGRGDEKQDAQNFWRELLQSVYGVEKPESDVLFEYPIKKETEKSTIFIDAYIKDTSVLIEQKGQNINLSKHYKPIDGGSYLFKKEEMEAFVAKEPASASHFRKWYGSDEFINRRPRYCLWLGECSPAELLKMPECMKRVEAVRNYRLASPSAGTRKIADKPTHFHVENMPKGTYIVIPEVSSGKRKYIPMGFMTPDILCSNLVKIMPSASLYEFGVLESGIHMAWMRATCGRMKSDYRYSKDIVYNNFPWPTATEEQRRRIEITAQGILNARERYPELSFAELYGEQMWMFGDLVTAHQQNDMAVLAAYGIKKGDPAYASESACVAFLMKRYQNLVARKEYRDSST